MKAFRKLSRVGTMTGSTRWYLSEDCLLAAKRMMYSVEYRRFYLRDLESIVVWRNPWWLWRPIIPAVLVACIGLCFWEWVNSTAGDVFFGVAATWVGLELALGPTARSRIRFTGDSITLPLVMRTRRAPKVLVKIDAAVRAARGVVEQTPVAAISLGGNPTSTNVEASQAASTVAATQTNAS